MMRQGLADWMLHHRRSLLFLMAVLVAGGIFSALKMPVSLFPSLSFPRIVVSIDAGSRPAHQMELQITRPVEHAVRGVPGVRRVSSGTSRGSSDVDIRFDWGTDMAQAVLQVQGALNQVQPELPAGTRFAVHRENPTRFPVIAYSLTSDQVSQANLRKLARYQLVPLLSGIQGVRKVDIMGGDTPEYRVTVDPARLAALSLSIQDVEQALSAANVVQAVGRLQEHNKLFLLLSDTRFRRIDAIRHMVLRSGQDGIVRLDDVAQVRRATKPKWRTVTADGKQAVLLMIKQQLGGNTVQIAHAVAAKLKANADLIPPGASLHKWYDQSGLIVSSAGSVRDAIILGVIFAVVVLFVFLRNWKVTLIALLVVPSVLASSAVLLHFLGMSFNIMTLGGMAAAVGLIIDDVIVMVEHLIRRLTEQGHHESSVLQSARDFTHPLAGSSTATVIIFTPLAFLSGVTGAFFQALSLTMATSLIVSFFFAWLAVPLIATRLLGPNDAERDRGGRGRAWLQRRYRGLMHGLMRHPSLILLGVGPLLAAGWLAFSHVPSGFMPEMNEGGFVLDYQTPPGTSLAETDRLLAQVGQILHNTPAVDTWSRRTGAQLGGGLTEANQGDFFIRLHSARNQTKVMNRIAQQIHHQVPGLNVLDMNQPMGDLIGDLTGSPRPVVIRLFGDNWQQLVKLAPKVAKAIGQVNGLKEIQDGLVIAGDAVNIHVDRVKASLEGLDPSQITHQLRALLSGNVTTRIQQGEQIIGVRVWIPGQLRDRLAKIRRLRLKAPDGHLVPVSRIAQLKVVTGVPQITRYDLKPAVAVSARIAGRGFGSTIADVKRVLAKPGLLPKGVYYQLGGLYKQQQIAFHDLMIVFIAAAALVFLALLFLYERFRIAIAILLTPMLAVSAVFVGLWLAGQTLNITALMGMTMIIGIVTEVAVFFFYELNQIGSDLPRQTALIEAGIRRFRPTLMTTLAAILALLPLGLGIGQGSAMQQPLAIAIISGLAVQIPLALVVMPVIYERLSRPRTRRPQAG